MTGAPASPEGALQAEPAGYDAFISFATAQRPQAERLQRRLQAVSPGRRRLLVYLDQTDLRGGALDDELNAALDRSRFLIVCCSPAAADSHWVRKEIVRFLQHHDPGRVLPVLLSGRPERSVPDLLDPKRLKWHDLRGWLFGRVPLPWAGDEVARMKALLLDAPLRELVDWERRRRRWRFHGTAFAVAAALGIAAGGWTHGRVSDAARALLARVAVPATEGPAIQQTRQAPPEVRRRALAIARIDPDRAAAAVASGWPVAAIGTDRRLAALALPMLRRALEEVVKEHVPAPREANYRYALSLVDDAQALDREAAALLGEIEAAKEEPEQYGIYWQRARRTAWLLGLAEAIRRGPQPQAHWERFRTFAESVAGDPDLETGVRAVEQAFAARGLKAEPPPEAAVPEEGAAAPGEMDPLADLATRAGVAEALAGGAQALARLARRRLLVEADASAAGPGPSWVALYDAALARAAKPAFAADEREAVRALLDVAAPPAAEQDERLRLATVFVARTGDAALRPLVGTRLLARLGPLRDGPPVPPNNGLQFAPAGIREEPLTALNTGSADLLIGLVAAEVSNDPLARGFDWKRLERFVVAHPEATARLLPAARLQALLVAERSVLDATRYAAWWSESAANYDGWVRYAADPVFLARELQALAYAIDADSDATRAELRFTCWLAAAQTSWRDRGQPIRPEDIAQLRRLVTHPPLAGRDGLGEALVPPWPEALRQGPGPFLAWADAQSPR